jgi:folate-dependent phosphoribosylglycinamide formyltransferase PurN
VPADRLTLVVFTAGRLGIELAGRLAGVPEVGALHLVTTDLPGRDRGVMERARLTWHRGGPPGVAHALAGRLLRPFRTSEAETLAGYAAEHCPRATHQHLPDLHSPHALARVGALAPDLGVVFGCYRLRRELFAIPRLGTLNLHLGRAPDFRGSSPGFYEMLDGVPEIGVTVHRVDDGLDSGPILLQESFPLDLAPEGDPLTYLQELQGRVLLPNGARLMADAVGRIARGEVVERPQAPGGRPRPRATWALKQELRRVVARRRAVDSPAGVFVS